MTSRLLPLIIVGSLAIAGIGYWQLSDRQADVIADAGRTAANPATPDESPQASLVAPPPPPPPPLTVTSLVLEQDGGTIDVRLARGVDAATGAPVDPTVEFPEDAAAIHVVLTSTIAEATSVRVAWRRVSGDPGLRPRDLDATTVRLRTGEPRAIQFRPPREGLLPGEYALDVSPDAGEPLSMPFRVVGRYAPAQAVIASQGLPGLNVALAALGGAVAAVTEESSADTWKAHNLIDGFPYSMGPGGGCAACGWQSSGRTFPQAIDFALAGDTPITIDRVVIDPSTEITAGDGASRIARNVEIWTSSSGEDADFQFLAGARLQPRPIEQLIAIPPTRARYVRVRVLDNWGGNTVQLGEVKVLEAPGPSALAALPRDLARPALGGVIARFTSQNGVRDGVQALTDGQADRPWRSTDDYFPQDIVLAFKDDQIALIDRIVLTTGAPDAPETWPKTVLVSTSDSDLFTFEDVGTFAVPAEPGDHALAIDREARFLRLRILENHGARRTTLNELAVIEGSRDGYVSVLARTGRLAGSTPPAAAASLDADASEREPNGDPAAAMPLALGTSVTGAISPIGEHDRYAIAIPGEGRQALTVDLAGTPYIRTSIALTATDGREIHRFDPSSVTAPETTFTWLTEPGARTLDVTEPPASIVLVWDTSLSMAGRTDALERAVRAYLDQVQPTERLNLIRFSDDVEVLLDDFSSDPEVLKAASEGKFKPMGGTRLHDAVQEAVALLDQVSGNRAIVVLSDGEDSASTLKGPAFWAMLHEKRIRLYTIGLGIALKGYSPRMGTTGQRFLGHAALTTDGRTFLARTDEELEPLYNRIAEELRLTSQYRIRPTASAATGTITVTPTGERIDSVAAPSRVELILDASGSMRRRIGDRRMIDAAKDVMAKVITAMPDGIEVGLRVYGHRIREGRAGDCEDSQLVQPIAPLDRDRLLARLKAVEALGTTPIAYSLAQVAGDLRGKDGDAMVVLVTDGKEECGGDPAAAVRALGEQGLRVRVNIVGFQLTDEAVRADMAAVASLTGGGYFDAQDDTALEEALARAMAARFAVRDAAGADVAAGQVGHDAVTVPEGTYTVVVQRAGTPLVVPGVKVTAGRSTAVELEKEGQTIGVQVTQP